MQVLVLGAGIAGLTSALVLARQGHDVGIFAAEHTPDTTSDVAAAVHYPFLARPREKVLAWGQESLRAWGELSKIDGTGVRWGDVLELTDDPLEDPWWTPMVADVEPAPDVLLPDDAPHGLVARVPFIDMRDLLPWLEARCESAGVTGQTGRVPSLDVVEGPWDAIVNCTGLGARELVDDEQLVPVRGQVAYVEDPGLERAVVDRRDEDQLTYIIPFWDRAVLGGTAERGIEDATPREEDIEAIRRRCEALEPRLEDAELLGAAAGLRPYRPLVRVERETGPEGRPIVHNYGHGGSGVTLAWGCAREVAALIEGPPPRP